METGKVEDLDSFFEGIPVEEVNTLLRVPSKRSLIRHRTAHCRLSGPFSSPIQPRLAAP